MLDSSQVLVEFFHFKTGRRVGSKPVVNGRDVEEIVEVGISGTGFQDILVVPCVVRCGLCVVTVEPNGCGVHEVERLVW